MVDPMGVLIALQAALDAKDTKLKSCNAIH